MFVQDQQTVVISISLKFDFHLKQILLYNSSLCLEFELSFCLYLNLFDEFFQF